MQRKNVIFIADSLDNAHKFQAVLSGFDIDVSAGSSMQFKSLLSDNPQHDLVIYEAMPETAGNIAKVEEALADDGGAAMLIIVPQALLSHVRPSRASKVRFCGELGKSGRVYAAYQAASLAGK